MKRVCIFCVLAIWGLSLQGQVLDTLSMDYIETIDKDQKRLVRTEWVLLKKAGKKQEPVTNNVDVWIPSLKKYKGIINGRVNQNDTIDIVLSNREGELLKWAQVKQDAVGTVKQEKPVASFEYQGQFPRDSQQLDLTAKSRFSFRKTIAALSVLRKYEQPSDTVILRVDSLFTPLIGTNWVDTLIQVSQGPKGKERLVREIQLIQSIEGSGKRSYKSLAVKESDRLAPHKIYSGFQVAPQWKWNRLRYDGIGKQGIQFEPLDTLIFAATPLDGTPFNKLLLVDDKGKMHGAALNSAGFSDTVVVSDEKYFEIKLRGKFNLLRRNRVKIDIMRFPRIKRDTFYEVVDTFYQVNRIPQLDTVMFPLKTSEIVVNALLNYEGTANRRISVFIPGIVEEDRNLDYVVYWIGIGDKSIDEYLKLEAEVPPDWAQPGVPIALGAFGMSHPVFLPAVRQKEVYFSLSNKGDMQRMIKGLKPEESSFIKDHYLQNYGIIHADSLEAFSTKDLITGVNGYELHFCAQNESQINTYPIQFKMIGFYTKVISESVSRKLLSIKQQREELKP